MTENTVEQVTQAAASATQAVAESVEEFSPGTLITALVLIALVLAAIVAVQFYVQYRREIVGEFLHDAETTEED